MKRVLFWLVPGLFLLLVYWQGLFSWFQQDDFAWMGLLREVREGDSLWRALFHPSQHGTWRPLGERAYFLFFPWVFGYEAWPMRVVAFLTQWGSLALAQAIMLRLTRSWGAALLTPILWAANSKLIIPMISNGAYIHVLSGFFLLLGLWFLMRGQWGAMWAAFLAGFGAMEMNVVFPALATLYCLLAEREKLRRVVWLWPVSAGYYVLHMALAPKMAGGSYAMHFDAGMAATSARYFRWAFVPDNLAAFTGLPRWAGTASGIVFPLLLLVFAGMQAARKQYLGLLFLGWFVILLAPVLPLSGHVTDYYLTVPLAALSMLGAFAASRHPWAAVPFVTLYLMLMVPCAYRGTGWWRSRSLVAERLVRRVFAAHAANPNAVILIEGVSSEQFWAALAHYPFVDHKKTYVYLTPGTDAHIEEHPESGVRMQEFFLSPGETERLRGEGRLLVLNANQAGRPAVKFQQ
ncbi:MAG: hypothetical protein IT165_33380 [Bryobacterales bacterium]|nr:hypothetical protein [Bryobacterales bacterium]